MIKKETGNIEEAIRYVILELIKRDEKELLNKWDEIRGTDWIKSRRLENT